MDFRTDAIFSLMNEIYRFRHYTFLSATAIDEEFEIPFLQKLPHYKVTWSNSSKILPIRIKAISGVPAGLAKLIQTFLNQGFILPDITNTKRKVEQLFIFINSVKTIEQICRTLELDPNDVKISCADRSRNKYILKDKYEIEPVSNPNKKINFFTKKGFQGTNMFSNNALIIVASDGSREQTLVDISTTMKQIAGRLRLNDEFQNCFRHIIVHIYSTNNHIPTDEEFEATMKQKHDDAKTIKDSFSKLNENERIAFLKRLNLESDIISVINGEIKDNPLKEQNFRYKHKLRCAYRDGFSVRNSYSNSDKFVVTNQQIMSEVNIIMKPVLTVSYQQLIKDYFENPNEQYELEYPEFKLYRKYLTLEQMHSLGWNKDKLMKQVEDKQQMNEIYIAVHTTGFISNKDLKLRFKEEFDKRNIEISPKATLIKDCTLYEIKKLKTGYEFGPMKFDFTI